MPRHPIGNRNLIRGINRSAVLNTVKTYGPIARTEIARRTGLSPAAITGLTAELIRQGLVFEKAPGDSRGGRRPILLELDPHGGFVVGIKLTEESIIAALTDLRAKVLVKRSMPLSGHDPEPVVEHIAETVIALRRMAEVPKSRLLGVGVGMAGVVDAERGLSRQQPFFHWRDVPLGAMLARRLRVMALIDNDVNALTLAERLYGAGQGVDDFLTVTIGRGVGLGVVAGGQLYRGFRGGGGEFGHTVVEVEGPLCNCGKRGCLEAFIGEYALLREAGKLSEQGMLPAVASVDELIQLAQRGHAAAREIFARAGDMLGRGIANLVNLFNPQLILISGEGVRMGEMVFGPMRISAERHTLPALRDDTELRVDPWGDDAWAVGAASLVLREIFASPLHQRAAKEAGG